MLKISKIEIIWNGREIKYMKMIERKESDKKRIRRKLFKSKMRTNEM
jgi:hypothetical protein